MRKMWVIVLMMLLSACGGEGTGVQTPMRETPAGNVEGGQANLETLLDNAFVIRATARTPVPAQQTRTVQVGEGVDVDEQGRALLRFGDLVTADITRDGELHIKQLSADERSAIANFVLVAGAVLFDFDPDAALQERLLVVESAFDNGQIAVVQATGTRFLVVREQEAPLVWVIGLDATENDLTIMADGVRKPVPAGMARWVAPLDEPSPGIQADMQAVQRWIELAQTGQPVREVGEVVWAFADIVSNLTPLQTLPPPGDPFILEGVRLMLGEGGRYALEDCNRDGNPDIAVQKGEIFFDFRAVLARVESLDLMIFNRAGPDTGMLIVFDPARKEIQRLFVQSQVGEIEVLSSRAPVPYHYATLRLEDGCFLGFSITPPLPNGEPAPPRAPEALEVQPFCETRVALRLRSAPSLEADVITTLSPGTKFTPLGRLSGDRWLLVATETEREAWLFGSSDYVTCVGYKIDALPLVEPTPSPTPASLPDLAIWVDDFKEACTEKPEQCQITVYALLYNTGATRMDDVEVQASADPDAFLDTIIEELPPSPNGLFWEFVLPPVDGSCYDPDCTICLVIDPYDDIAESNEENNKVCQTWQR